MFYLYKHKQCTQSQQITTAQPYAHAGSYSCNKKRCNPMT